MEHGNIKFTGYIPEGRKKQFDSDAENIERDIGWEIKKYNFLTIRFKPIFLTSYLLKLLYNEIIRFAV